MVLLARVLLGRLGLTRGVGAILGCRLIWLRLKGCLLLLETALLDQSVDLLVQLDRRPVLLLVG